MILTNLILWNVNCGFFFRKGSERADEKPRNTDSTLWNTIIGVMEKKQMIYSGLVHLIGNGFFRHSAKLNPKNMLQV